MAHVEARRSFLPLSVFSFFLSLASMRLKEANKSSQTRGDHFRGQGDPMDKLQASYKDPTGQDDSSKKHRHVDSADIANMGQEASRSNVGANPAGVGGSRFKGDEYYTPESVPDSISAEGWVAPDSVVQGSKEAESIRK